MLIEKGISGLTKLAGKGSGKEAARETSKAWQTALKTASSLTNNNNAGNNSDISSFDAGNTPLSGSSTAPIAFSGDATTTLAGGEEGGIEGGELTTLAGGEEGGDSGISIGDIGGSTPSADPSPYEIDWDFISEQEGGQRLDGYIPTDSSGQAVGRSGVTVATGVDIGQRSEQEIRALDIPESLKDKLVPYADLKQDDAINALDANPLTLTEEEADALDQAIKGDAVDALATRYDAATGGSPRFDELPPQAQTVIASVEFQYGNLEAATPDFWATVTAQDWDGAERELRNFGDDFPSRRNREADLLATL